MIGKNYLFVDGSNLYAGQYDLFGPNQYLNFTEFIKTLEECIKTTFDNIYFYASYSPKPKILNKKVKLYLKNEAFFYKSVKSLSNVVFFKGYRSETSGKEKEVDVKLAIDIVDFCHRKLIKKLYLFSGDADFMHALKIAENFTQSISVIALENRVPHRFAFFYPTYICNFDGKMPKISSRQKIIRIDLLKDLAKPL